MKTTYGIIYILKLIQVPPPIEILQRKFTMS